MTENTNTTPTQGADPDKDLTQTATLQQQAVAQGVKTPQDISPEQFKAQLLLDYQYGFDALIPAFKDLSAKGKNRIFTALMQLPHAGMEVSLNGDNEREIFLAGQKVLYAKHALVFSRMKQEAQAEQAAIAETERKRLAKESELAQSKEDEASKV